MGTSIQSEKLYHTYKTTDTSGSMIWPAERLRFIRPGSPQSQHARTFSWTLLPLHSLLGVLALPSLSRPVLTKTRGHIVGPPPLPDTVRASIFLPSSTREEFYLPTLSAVSRSQKLIPRFFAFFSMKIKSNHVGIELQDQR